MTTLTEGMAVIVEGRGSGVVDGFTYRMVDGKQFGWVIVRLDAGGRAVVAASLVRPEEAAAA